MSIQNFDNSLLLAMNRAIGESGVLDTLAEALAVYSIYAVPVVLVFLWFKKVRGAGIRAALSGLLTWLIFSPILGAIWYRPRPSLAELGGREVLFHRPTYSFPSDHAAFLTAFALTLYFNGNKKIATAFFVLIVLVSAARVAVGFHYPTDIVGGIALGFFVAWLVNRGRDSVDRYIARPLIALAKSLRLA